jgi:PAS domain S-box-containing protein
MTDQDSKNESLGSGQADEEVLKALADNIPAWEFPFGYYLVDRDGYFVRCSQGIRRILGLPEQGPIDQKIDSFYSDRGDRIRQIDSAKRKPGTFSEWQEIRFNVSGREVWVRVSCRALYSAGSSELVGFLGSIEDVTDTVIYRKLVDSLPAGIYRADANGRFTMTNRALPRMLGYDSPDDMIGRRVADFYADESVEAKSLVSLYHQGSASNERVELVSCPRDIFTKSFDLLQD